MECKNGNGTVIKFPRKDFLDHKKKCPNRDYQCTYCKEKGTYYNITHVHDKVCPLKPFPCPNECGYVMYRQDIDNHVQSECKYTVVKCKYRSIGCKRETKREKMAIHEEDDKIHFQVVLKAMVHFQDAFEATKNTAALNFKTMKKSIADLKSKLEDVTTVYQPVTFVMMDYSEKKEASTKFLSPSFYTSPEGYHMAVSVYTRGFGDAKGTHVSVFASMLEGKYDSKLKWPFVGEIKIAILNQLKDKNHYNKIISVTAASDLKAGSAQGFNQFIPHSALACNPAKNMQYLKDDTLYFRVSVEVDHCKPWLQCTAK